MNAMKAGTMKTAALLVIGFLALRTASAADNILKPANDAKNWRFEQHEDGKGKISVDGDAIVFEVTNVDGTEWHVQAFQTPLDLKDGKEYTITFKAKADDPREVGVQAGIDEEDWHMIGLDEKAELGKDWKDYKYTFTANDVKANKNRVGFVLGSAKGKVWVKDLVLKGG
ncbi:MAG TPA: carbohydrate binding domain-containing protein [Tepidisphaeraceae bacterium]|nr:carbohydrate binding domain-containing protein [Tepidisphaeraceae bacterium]